MVYKFPNVSFDWLGDLPGIAEESRLRTARSEALADLNASDPKSLRDAANKLTKTGGLKEMEMSLRLHQAALGREQLAQKSATDANWAKIAPSIYQQLAPRGGGAPGSSESTFDPLAGNIPEAAPSIPWGPNPLAVPPGPQSAAPPQAPMPPVAAAPPGPSEQILAAAESPQGPAPMGPQMAQAGPGPGPAMPSPAGQSAGPPSWLQGAQAQPMTVPQPKPTPPPGRPDPRLGPISSDQQAQEEASRLTGMLIQMGPKAPTSAVQAVRAQLNNALDRLKMDKDQKNYTMDRIQSIAMGEGDFSRRDWETDKKGAQKRYEGAVEAYSRYRKEEQKGKSVIQSIGDMRTVLDHPRFATGEPGLIDAAQKQLVSLIDTLRAFGVPDSVLPGRDTIAGLTQPAALREAFTSLGNQLVTNYLGGLGPAISNTDRDYIGGAFPSLAKTKAGNELIVQFLEKVAERKQQEGHVARAYMEKEKVRATEWGMDAAVEKVIKPFAEGNGILISKDGMPTALGQRMQIEISKSQAAEKAPQAPVPQTPASRTTYGPSDEGKTLRGPDGKRYKIFNGEIVPFDTQAD